jgi:hypothetical protein
MSSEANSLHPPQANVSRHVANGTDDEVFGNSIHKKVAHGFHMQIQTQQVPKARKRKRDTKGPNHQMLPSSMSLSSSSSSSSDEDDETKREGTPSASSEDSTNPSPKDGDSQRGSQPEPEPKSDASTSNDDNDNDRSTTSEPGKSPTKGPQQTHPTHKQSHQHEHQHEHEHHSATHHQIPHQAEGWRVKLYRLNADGSWDDCGTGRILCLYKQPPKAHETSNNNTSSSNMAGDAWVYQELGEPTLCMHAEVTTPSGTTMPRILLRTRILLRDAYQRQGDNIITWCEPYLEEGNPAQGVDLALSFQDNAGCLDIWRQITSVQSKAADLFRRNGGGERSAGGGSSNSNESAGSPTNPYNEDVDGSDGASISPNNNGNSVADVAHAVAAAHHANLQRQQQQEMWVNVASEAAQHHLEHQTSLMNHDQHFEDSVGGMVAGFHDSNSSAQTSNNPQSPQLPNPPTLANLEEIADTIAAVQVCQQNAQKNVFVLSIFF